MKAKRVFCIFLSLCMILGMFANLSPVAHATEESNCTHYVEHEPECSNGADCVHECELCAVQSLIDALPTIEEYGIMDEAAKIAAQQKKQNVKEAVAKYQLDYYIPVIFATASCL